MLKAPSPVSSQPGAPPPPARGSRGSGPHGVRRRRRAAATAHRERADRRRRARARHRCAPPPGCRPPWPRPRPPTSPTARVRALTGAGDGAGRRPRRRRRAGTARRSTGTGGCSRGSSAVPLGFLLTAWPAYELGFIEKDDLLDIFVGTGTGRYVRLGIVTLVWAVVTALLVQLFVEGGRAWANRRRRARAAAA